MTHAFEREKVTTMTHTHMRSYSSSLTQMRLLLAMTQNYTRTAVKENLSECRKTKNPSDLDWTSQMTLTRLCDTRHF